MKISILTFSKESNFGANLQCYALCQILQKMGHQVDVIDIQLKKCSIPWYSTLIRLPMAWYFYRFRKRFLNRFTRRFNSIEDLRNHYPKSDLYIVGSDQVWNPSLTKQLDPLIYFFSFLPPEASRISYAASFGTMTWETPEITETVCKLLHQFNAISVREDVGVDICEKTFNVNATHVLDPTLLLLSYDEICGVYDSSKETNELIYYTFVHDAFVRNVIADFAESYNLQAINLYSNHPYRGFKQIIYVSVAKWLNAIRYSKVVVTNSFHCMIFCLIFHKQFVVIPGALDRLSRQESILKELRLLDYYCSDKNNLSQYLEKALHTNIDYNVVDETLAQLRQKSLAFLEGCCQSC